MLLYCAENANRFAPTMSIASVMDTTQVAVITGGARYAPPPPPARRFARTCLARLPARSQPLLRPLCVPLRLPSPRDPPTR